MLYKLLPFAIYVNFSIYEVSFRKIKNSGIDADAGLVIVGTNSISGSFSPHLLTLPE
jgi:hypothetical protein